jgi:parallel beta-helix repeat protein
LSDGTADASFRQEGTASAPSREIFPQDLAGGKGRLLGCSTHAPLDARSKGGKAENPMRRHLRSSIVITMALALVAALDLMGAPAALAATVNVGPGQSIQAAINAASPGDTIVVAPGTYRENIEINKNNITLQGTPGGTVLAPPGAAKVTHNACFVSATNFDGICLAQVSGVTVSGFTVRGFPGVGIHSINSDHLTITNNRLNNNGLDGIADYGGSFNTISDNQAAGSSEAGILVADSTGASTTISGNTATNNGVGIYVRDVFGFAPGAFTTTTVIHNTANGNCVGILALDTPDGPATFAIDILGNTTNANNKTCAPTQYLPVTTSGTGILDIADQSGSVRGNTVRDNVPSDLRLPYAGGIVLAPYPGPNGPPLRDANVGYNTAYGNQPIDIRYLGPHPGQINKNPYGIGTGIIFAFNNCDTSQPKTIYDNPSNSFVTLCRPTAASESPGYPGF